MSRRKGFTLLEIVKSEPEVNMYVHAQPFHKRKFFFTANQKVTFQWLLLISSKKGSACLIASPVNNTAQKTLDAVALVEDTVAI